MARRAVLEFWYEFASTYSYLSAMRIEEMAAAAELQRRMSLAEQGFAQAGLNGTKWLVVSNRGYPAASVHCRRPIPRFADVKKMASVAEVVSAVLPIEHKLAQQGAGS